MVGAPKMEEGNGREGCRGNGGLVEVQAFNALWRRDFNAVLGHHHDHEE